VTAYVATATTTPAVVARLGREHAHGTRTSTSLVLQQAQRNCVISEWPGAD
jgi:hypothetical protein